MTKGELFGVSVLMAILAFVAAAVLTSANHFMEVTKFNVLDTPAGEAIPIEYEREIKREFQAAWDIDLYKDSVWVARAESPGVHTYRTLAVLPDGIDMDWMTYGNPAFVSPDCGSYRIVVRWIVNPDSILWRRVVEARDSFEVMCK